METFSEYVKRQDEAFFGLFGRKTPPQEKLHNFPIYGKVVKARDFQHADQVYRQQYGEPPQDDYVDQQTYNRRKFDKWSNERSLAKHNAQPAPEDRGGSLVRGATPPRPGRKFVIHFANNQRTVLVFRKMLKQDEYQEVWDVDMDHINSQYVPDYSHQRKGLLGVKDAYDFQTRDPYECGVEVRVLPYHQQGTGNTGMTVTFNLKSTPLKSTPLRSSSGRY